MRLDSNSWNRRRYTLWAPVYDLLVGSLDAGRRASLRLLAARPGETILIVGAGTGADLPYLPPGCVTLATDLTPAMLARARRRVHEGVHLAVMDGRRLAVRGASCDGAVLHLVLAVMPDPALCLQEVARSLRPAGRIVVFDKFVRGSRAPVVLRALNLVSKLLFSDLTRRFEDILERSGAPLQVVQDRPALAGGFYRCILLRKTQVG